MDFSKLLYGFVKIDTWSSLSFSMYLSIFMDFFQLLNGFAKVVLCASRPLPSTTKPKFDEDEDSEIAHQ